MTGTSADTVDVHLQADTGGSQENISAYRSLLAVRTIAVRYEADGDAIKVVSQVK
jgi:hypothetical protein